MFIKLIRLVTNCKKRAMNSSGCKLNTGFLHLHVHPWKLGC